MILVGMGVICWIMIRGKLNRKRSVQSIVLPALKHNGNATGQPATYSGTHSLGAPREVLQWQIELHDLGRELKGELDSKMLAVRALTQSYDRAAQRLSDLIKMAEQIQLTTDSPLHEVRALDRAGWSAEKISAHTGIGVVDVKTLLTADYSAGDRVHANRS